MVWQTTAEGGADGSAKFPVKESQQIMIHNVAIDAHVVDELGQVNTLFGEHSVGAWSTAVIAERISAPKRVR